MNSIKGKDFVRKFRNLKDLSVETFELLTPQAETDFGKPIGTYTSIVGDVLSGDGKVVADVFKEAFGDFVEQSKKPLKKFLTVGFGNNAIAAESLGPTACDKLTQINRKFKTLKISLSADTDITPADAVVQKTEETNQSHTILIAQVATKNPNALHSLHIATGNGITPGSASNKFLKAKMIEQFLEDYNNNNIDNKHMESFLDALKLNNINELQIYLEDLKNANKKIDSTLLQTPVITIGVPMMLKPNNYNQFSIKKITENYVINENGFAVPRDTALTRDAISFYSEKIANAINKADSKLK